MSFFAFADSVVKRMTWFDLGLLKLSVMAFTLMVAKLWSPILRLKWYVYAIAFVLTAIPIIYRVFSGPGGLGRMASECRICRLVRGSR